jgi:hypothetical protein
MTTPFPDRLQTPRLLLARPRRAAWAGGGR